LIHGGTRRTTKKRNAEKIHRIATTEGTETTEVRRRESRGFRRKCSGILLLLISVNSVPSVVKLLFAVDPSKDLFFWLCGSLCVFVDHFSLL
jgi:hypothetical protein